MIAKLYLFVGISRIYFRVFRRYGFEGLRKFYKIYDLNFPSEMSLKFRDLLISSLGQDKDKRHHVAVTDNFFNYDGLSMKAIAFYLPQFHVVKENEDWWGGGFTEWTNVTKALPQYAGHYQPHLPGDLGFYDLEIPYKLRNQVELAKKYGLYGFCFHYYYFSGRKILETPINNLLKEKAIDFPFCICWANESWTRRWDGSETDVLLQQVYSEDNDLGFIKDIEVYLRDDRYIRFSGKPIIVVYKVSDLPDPKKTVLRWREYCRDVGIGEIHLIAALSFNIKSPLSYGFDAGVEFPPHNIFSTRVSNKSLRLFNKDFSGAVHSYEALVASELAFKNYDFPCYRTAFPSWDNEARKTGKGLSFFGANPESFMRWLIGIMGYAKKMKESSVTIEEAIFINAWNEWAEGAHLEPDRRFGYAYLDSLSKALSFHKILK